MTMMKGWVRYGSVGSSWNEMVKWLLAQFLPRLGLLLPTSPSACVLVTSPGVSSLLQRISRASPEVAHSRREGVIKWQGRWRGPHMGTVSIKGEDILLYCRHPASS